MMTWHARPLTSGGSRWTLSMLGWQAMGSRAENRKDLSTLSNCDDVKSTHLNLNLAVDFGSHTLKGWAEHTMTVVKAGVSVAVFDTSSEMKVEDAEVDGKKAAWNFLTAHEVFGTPVQVTLPAGLAAGTVVKVKLHYSTSANASACQWLPPEQTAGKRYPYLFTQSQAIHARSIFPCQDAPAVKMTYEATVTAPAWATVLMSALQDVGKDKNAKTGSTRTFVWRQPVPIPSYLVALAVGELKSMEISPRVRVWAEPSVVERAHYEFGQTEEFLQHAEALTFPYEWQRYDLLCLPPSFPYGGMENPCLTFVTPTLLAGDRSLADVVAHEISHSWSGNLVTNHTWEHFWLNEGWTMWLQRKIMTRIHKNPLFFDMDAASIGWPHLVDDIANFAKKPNLTALIPDIKGVDPDDAFSSVPYEKGFSLIYYIEQIVGASAFEAFAKHYFSTYKKGTVTSADFKRTLLAYFKDDARLTSLPWDDLFYKPGLPPKPQYDTSLAQQAEALADKWYVATSVSKELQDSAAVFNAWPTVQKQIFLERLLSEAEKKGPMRVPFLEQIDGVLKLTSVKNCELRLRWNLLCLRAGAKFILENTVEFVTSQGRMKYVRPLYREMFKSPMAKTLAIETFLKHASSYHPIARKMVAADLHIKTGEAGASAEANGGASHAARALKLDRSVLALLVIGTAALGVALFLARKKGVKRA